MLRKALALFFCVGAVSYAAAQTPKPGAKPTTATARPAATRTPAQEARDEWNRGAVAYRAGKFVEAQKHFERVRQLDPKFKDVRLYIARAIAQQYRPGVEDADNVAKGEEGVAAFEALLRDEPANDDAFRSLLQLLTNMRSPDRVREVVLRRVNDATLPVSKRADLLLSLASSDLKCAHEVTERNKETAAEPGNKGPVKYKMPADGGDFYRAQQCAASGLNYTEHALQLAPDHTPTLTARAGLLRELAKLSEMEGNTGQKEFYDAQHAEVRERLRGLGVDVAPGAAQTPPAEAAPAQTDAGGSAATPVRGGILNGKATHLPQPEYPPAARAANAEGTVTVQVVIDEAGNVVSAAAMTGHPLLREAAEQAARQARFSPTLLSGQPVRVSGVLTYEFRRQ
jgi:TonB family protein